MRCQGAIYLVWRLFWLQFYVCAISFGNVPTKQEDSLKYVRFVPHPHLMKLNGYLEWGDWVTIPPNDIMKSNSTSVLRKKSLDAVQRAAFEEGIFIPKKLNSSNSASSLGLQRQNAQRRDKQQRVNIFSANEARACLRGKKILFAGDSYMRQFYIGLGDIILGDPDKKEIRNKETRDEVFSLIRNRLKQVTGLDIRFILTECSYKDLSCVLKSLKKYISFIRSADTFVMNFLVHHVDEHKNDKNLVQAYISDLKQIFNLGSEGEKLPIVWATGPAYDLAKVPSKYQQITMKRPTALINKLSIQEADATGTPLLDIETLTARCLWSNCSSDGGHRSRFVNRMKAQMLLNNLCEIDPNYAKSFYIQQ